MVPPRICADGKMDKRLKTVLRYLTGQPQKNRLSFSCFLNLRIAGNYRMSTAIAWLVKKFRPVRPLLY